MSTRDFNEQSITDAVVDRFADTPDARLKQIMQSLVRHTHDFVRDVELTQDEWFAAIMFLTRTGQMSDDKRQEFILLSDTLGISMLVDAINHRQPAGATETTVLGPFYTQNPPVRPSGADI
ncbi:MAG: dioxygenase, partial [Devosia sp.]|nr:dioxygenase [Devosia sp.]